MGQGPGLTGASPGNNPDIALGGGDRLPLGWVQMLQQLQHRAFFLPNRTFVSYIIAGDGQKRKGELRRPQLRVC